MSSGNFLIAIVLGGSLGQLWSTIRALQMIILIILIDIFIPVNSLIFFQACIKIAEMDLMQGEKIYEENL